MLRHGSVADDLRLECFATATRAIHDKITEGKTGVSSEPDRCGIVLAGGDGKRLSPFIFRLRGDALPKQYVNFIGSRSMLEHTFSRAEKLIPPERLFTVVSEHHLSHAAVRRQLSTRAKGTVVVQPENKETGPGLLLPLFHLYRRYPDSTVVIFPSDHFILEEELFIRHVDLACQAVEQHPGFLVMLGIGPSEPETEYGYILPSQETHGRAQWGVRKVIRFIEKPEFHVARELILRDGLWNSMVTAFKVETMLDLIEGAAPLLFSSFDRIREAIGTIKERNVLKESYARMKAINFSRAVLEAVPPNYPSPLMVLPVRDVFWSDWGSEERISSVMRPGIFGNGTLHHFRVKTQGFINLPDPGEVMAKAGVFQSSARTVRG